MKISIKVYSSNNKSHKIKVFDDTSSIIEINNWINSINPNQNISTCIISRINIK